MDDILGAAAVIVFAIGIMMVLAVLFRPKPRVQVAPAPDKPPENAILVDGSNVMHWGGDPSQMVLTRVVHDLRERGFTPIVVFDASVGYRLSDRYIHGPQMAQLIGLPLKHVHVVQKGVIADEVLLELARIHGLRVVSQDRFRDWRGQFPAIAKKGAIVRGVWKEGSVVWSGKGL